MDPGGAQEIFGTAIATVVTSSYQQVYAGGTASFAGLDSGGIREVYGTAINTVVNQSSFQEIYAGGTDSLRMAAVTR